MQRRIAVEQKAPAIRPRQRQKTIPIRNRAKESSSQNIGNAHRPQT